MKWFTSKARERALKAERERDGFRWGLKKYQGEVNELTAKLAEALEERDEAREARDRFRSERDEAHAENQALWDQLQALESDRDITRQAYDSSLEKLEALRDQLQAVTAERDEAERLLRGARAGRDKARANNQALLDGMALVKEIAEYHIEENES